MTNFEKYKDENIEILSSCMKVAVIDGELKPCSDISCTQCDLYIEDRPCRETTKEWLLADDGTPSAERLEGQREAWELAQKITTYEKDGGLTIVELNEIFGQNCLAGKIMLENTYAEAAEKAKAWEDGFKAGDIVEYRNTGCIGVVTCTEENTISGIREDGKNFFWCKGNCGKTGRTLPVSDWLRQIGGVANETEN